MELIFENLFVLCVLLLSGGYILRRLQRMAKLSKAKQSGCNDCVSSTCGSSAAKMPVSGETLLKMKQN